MPSAGGICPPTIIALKHSGVVPGNKIDTNTYVELTTEARGCRIYFTTDGTKPLPRGSTTGVKNSTHKYSAPFTMRPGNRILKAVCVRKHDERESAVVTRNYKVCEPAGTPDSSDCSSDSMDYMQRRVCKPSRAKCDDIVRSHSISRQIQVPAEKLVPPEAPHNSINYSGTQINIWGPVPQGAIEELSRGYGGNKNQRRFGANQSGNYNGFLTEEMLKRAEGRAEDRQLLTVGDLRSALGRCGPQIEEVQERVPIEYKQMGDPPVSSRSPGNGDWRGQLTHIYAHLTSRAKLDAEFLGDLSYAKLGQVTSAELVQADEGYRLAVCLENAGVPSRGKPARKPEKARRVDPGEAKEPAKPTQSCAAVAPGIQRKRSAAKNVEPYYMTESYEQSGTVRGVEDLNAEEDAAILRKAMKGLGTDEKALINILCTRTNIQRQKIAAAYKSSYGRDLKEDVRGETSGNFRVLLLGLLEEGVEFDARELRRAMQGVGTDEDVLVEIICTRTGRQLGAIKEAYERLFKRSLEGDVVGDTSGDFRRVMVALLQNAREEGDTFDMNKVREDVGALRKAGADSWGTDESVFNRIIVNRSFAFLRALFGEYLKETGHQFEEALKKEMSGDLLRAFLAVVRSIHDKPAFFAKKLWDAMKGLGTKDDTLVRIVVSRCEVDLVQIKEKFHLLTNQTLAMAVKGETSGDYQTALLLLIGK